MKLHSRPMLPVEEGQEMPVGRLRYTSFPYRELKPGTPGEPAPSFFVPYKTPKAIGSYLKRWSDETGFRFVSRSSIGKAVKDGKTVMVQGVRVWRSE